MALRFGREFMWSWAYLTRVQLLCLIVGGCYETNSYRRLNGYCERAKYSSGLYERQLRTLYCFHATVMFDAAARAYRHGLQTHERAQVGDGTGSERSNATREDFLAHVFLERFSVWVLLCYQHARAYSPPRRIKG